MKTVSIEGAEQVLRPPRDRMQHLRGPAELNGQTIVPGDVAIDAGMIAGFAADSRADVRIDASGCAVIPGLVDCHTHLPFAGWRAGEYEQKLTGVPYEEISRSGGGIKSSARALASMTDDQVLAQATTLASEMLATGTTTFECKSGYGLSREGELRLLRLARELAGQVTQTTLSTRVAGALDPRRVRRGVVDGGRRGDDAVGAGARHRVGAGHLRRVDRVWVG